MKRSIGAIFAVAMFTMACGSGGSSPLATELPDAAILGRQPHT